jgi:hypothetical protein
MMKAISGKLSIGIMKLSGYSMGKHSFSKKRITEEV